MNFATLIGFQIADAGGRIVQGEDGFDRYGSFEVLRPETAAEYLRELCARDARAYTLCPVFGGEIEAPTVV